MFVSFVVEFLCFAGLVIVTLCKILCTCTKYDGVSHIILMFTELFQTY